jgi:hypothetical protein
LQNSGRTVFAYYGCLEPRAADLLSGAIPIRDWPRSQNKWDWLGHGIYFWEHAPERAIEWARAAGARRGRGETPAVVGAIIHLGECFDLSNPRFTDILSRAYERLEKVYRDVGQVLPANSGDDEDMRRRDLDCLVLNYCLEKYAEGFSSVRCPFLEGPPAYPGARIRRRAHIQIAVRDPSCILGVFRPNIVGDEGARPIAGAPEAG